MPSDMADHAAELFREWFRKTESNAGGEVFVSLAGAYQEWLRRAGLSEVSEQYTLAVETLLVVLSNEPPRPGLPVIEPGDAGAWDYMTRTGFRYECRKFGRRR